MDDVCLACSRKGCFEASAPPPVSTIAIRASVGEGGVNQTADVRVVQEALNDVEPTSGGPEVQLKVDGIAGTRTRAAIRRFQAAKVLRIIDGRADPHGPTIAALNAEFEGTVPVLAGTTGRRRPRLHIPNPDVVPKMVSLLGKVRLVIRAADFHCSSADRFVTARGLEVPSGPFNASSRLSLNLLHTAFRLGAMKNPRPSFDNIRRVYRNMVVALNRSFETDPLVAPILFVPNNFAHIEDEAVAYTSAGGAFKSSNRKLKGLGVPANRIYVCNNFMTDSELDQVATAVHELAHYVSGQPILIKDVVKTGRILNPVDKPRFDAITPEQKVRSAAHYEFFAMLCGFRRLQDDHKVAGAA